MAKTGAKFVPYGECFEYALVYAAQLHRRQARNRTKVPYITHLLAVAAIVGENGGTEEEVIAALLHDAVEDQGGTPRLSEIRERFGDTVAEIVAGCTDTDEIPKPPWRERKESYIAHLATAPPSVILVSAADKLHNARSIVADLRTAGPIVWERFTGREEGTRWYYGALVTAFAERANVPSTQGEAPLAAMPIIGELRRCVDQMEVLAAPSASDEG